MYIAYIGRYKALTGRGILGSYMHIYGDTGLIQAGWYRSLRCIYGGIQGSYRQGNTVLLHVYIGRYRALTCIYRGIQTYIYRGNTGLLHAYIGLLQAGEYIALTCVYRALTGRGIHCSYMYIAYIGRYKALTGRGILGSYMHIYGDTGLIQAGWYRSLRCIYGRIQGSYRQGNTVLLHVYCIYREI